MVNIDTRGVPGMVIRAYRSQVLFQTRLEFSLKVFLRRAWPSPYNIISSYRMTKHYDFIHGCERYGFGLGIIFTFYLIIFMTYVLEYFVTYIWLSFVD